MQQVDPQNCHQSETVIWPQYKPSIPFSRTQYVPLLVAIRTFHSHPSAEGAEERAVNWSFKTEFHSRFRLVSITTRSFLETPSPIDWTGNCHLSLDNPDRDLFYPPPAGAGFACNNRLPQPENQAFFIYLQVKRFSDKPWFIGAHGALDDLDIICSKPPGGTGLMVVMSAHKQSLWLPSLSLAKHDIMGKSYTVMEAFAEPHSFCFPQMQITELWQSQIASPVWLIDLLMVFGHFRWSGQAPGWGCYPSLKS